MTNKELIGILQALPPDDTPSFSLGRCDEAGHKYRKLCAKAELIEGECLNFLAIDRIEIIEDPDDSSIWADIHLIQENLSGLESLGKEFDKQYKKV